MSIPEKPRHMGRYWCWVFWEFKVDVLRCVKCVCGFLAFCVCNRAKTDVFLKVSRLAQSMLTTKHTFHAYQPFIPRLMKCEEIVCRAWQGQNTQPQNITWNLLGMMNNCWFRCKVHPTRDDRGALALTFEHPTMPGPQPGGWMVKGSGVPGGGMAAKAPPPKVCVCASVGFCLLVPKW